MILKTLSTTLLLAIGILSHFLADPASAKDKFDEGDFYVRSRGIRIKSDPGNRESSYQAIKSKCDKENDPLLCFYMGLYLMERGAKKLAHHYFDRACKLGHEEACKTIK